jgi:hypothetical protein
MDGGNEMNNYLNFSPGSMRHERSFEFSEEPAYAIEDLDGFVQSVLYGTTSSLDCSCWKDMCEALEDGAVLEQWFDHQDNEEETEEQRAQREAVEEVHAALKEE